MRRKSVKALTKADAAKRVGKNKKAKRQVKKSDRARARGSK